MSAWPKQDIRIIAEADDLHISPFREDGVTYGTPTWIWSVAVDDGLYVRGYNGQQSRWYQAALKQKAGQITTAGMTKEVAFEPVKGAINDRIDDAYREKYKGSPYLKPMISERARLATVRIKPRNVASRCHLHAPGRTQTPTRSRFLDSLGRGIASDQDCPEGWLRARGPF